MAAIFVYSPARGEETEHYKIKQPIRQKSPLLSQPRNSVHSAKEAEEQSPYLEEIHQTLFFLRSAASGKRCILHIEYFIESA